MLFKKVGWQVFVFLLLTLALVLAGCANFEKRSYASMGTMAVSYDMSMKSAADLHKRGFISDEGKAKIISAGNSYAESHNEAIDAFIEYVQLPPEQKETKKAQTVAAMQAALSFYSTLLDILYDSGVSGEPVEPWF